MWCPENLGLMGKKVWGLWLNLWGAFLFVPVCKAGSGALITEVACKEPQKYVSVSLQRVETSSCPSHPSVSFWKLYFLRLPDLSYLRCNCQSGSLKIKLSHWCTCSNFASRASGVTASTPRRWSFPNFTISKLQAHIRTLVHKNKWVGDWWRKMISL